MNQNRVPGILIVDDKPAVGGMVGTMLAPLTTDIEVVQSGKVHRYLTKPIVITELVGSISEELSSGEKDRAEIIRLRKVIDQLSSD
jgi:response regulator RpfG family c-di-GMP phosphodiesterase